MAIGGVDEKIMEEGGWRKGCRATSTADQNKHVTLCPLMVSPSVQKV